MRGGHEFWGKGVRGRSDGPVWRCWIVCFLAKAAKIATTCEYLLASMQSPVSTNVSISICCTWIEAGCEPLRLEWSCTGCLGRQSRYFCRSSVDSKRRSILSSRGREARRIYVKSFLHADASKNELSVKLSILSESPTYLMYYALLLDHG